MLELRPNCEHCNKPLPADSTQAMICSYECTFCQSCVDDVLFNVCPNCGGGFCQRPVRPSKALKNNFYLGQHPASIKAVLAPVNEKDHILFAAEISNIPAHKR